MVVCRLTLVTLTFGRPQKALSKPSYIYTYVPQQERILNSGSLDFLSSETSRRATVVEYNFFYSATKSNLQQADS